MANGSASLLIKHRGLLFRVTRNELASRYAGSLLGIGWAVLAPLLLIFIYAVVYLVIFRVKVPGLSAASYVVYIFSGLIPFLATSEAISLGVPSVIANKAVLNNTVFPIDLAPVKAVLLSQVTMVVGMGTILVGAIVTGTIAWTMLLVPLIWMLQVIALIGLNWILALLNVVFRDLQNLITVILMLLMVVSPIAYTPDMVPPNLVVIILLNPFAYFVTAYQSTVVLGELPTIANLLALFVIAIGLFMLGNWMFSRAKRVVTDYV